MNKFACVDEINLKEGDIVHNFVTKLSMKFIGPDEDMLKFELLNSKIENRRVVSLEPYLLVTNSWGLFNNEQRTRS